MSFWGFRPYVPVAERRLQAMKAIEKLKERRSHQADQDRRPQDRQHLLGQGLVRKPGALFRLRQPAAARTNLCPQRLGDRSEDRPGQSGGAGQRLRHLQSENRHRGRRAATVEGDLRRLRGFGGVVDRTDARQASKNVMERVCKRRRRPVSHAERDHDVLLLSGLGGHVQACGGHAVRRRGAARRGSRPLFSLRGVDRAESSRPSAPTCR